MGEGKGASASLTRMFFSVRSALPISTATPPTHIPSGEHRRRRAGIFSSSRRAFSSTQLQLRAARGLVPSLEQTLHTVLPERSHCWYKYDDGLWWLGNISARTTADGEIFIAFSGRLGTVPISYPLRLGARLRQGSVRGSWCLQINSGSALFVRGVQRNVGEYHRGADVNTLFFSLHSYCIRLLVLSVFLGFRERFSF